ncbi:MAG: hypothetical protein PVJ67_06865 [Candidatus Pacearchaeota archaeon]|jgi:hypothetical protein
MKLEDLKLGKGWEKPIRLSPSVGDEYFPSLEKALNLFYEKNNLEKPENLMSTGKGLIATISGVPLIISRKNSEGFPALRNQPLAGSGISKAKDSTYTLKTRLNGKEIELETDIIYDQRYIRVQVMGGTELQKSGEPRILRRRLDGFKDKYWFLDD